jgi:hypothetical protein
MEGLAGLAVVAFVIMCIVVVLIWSVVNDSMRGDQ